MSLRVPCKGIWTKHDWKVGRCSRCNIYHNEFQSRLKKFKEKYLEEQRQIAACVVLHRYMAKQNEKQKQIWLKQIEEIKSYENQELSRWGKRRKESVGGQVEENGKELSGHRVAGFNSVGRESCVAVQEAQRGIITRR